jgi:Resolvase, N terminal domain/Recombinase
MESAVEFVALDNPHANKLTVHILAAAAQHEREIISARTSAALQAAKARGKRLGNPRLSAARRRAAAANIERADQYSAIVLPVIREIQASGIKSLRGIARALAGRGVPTARGGAWTPVQVSDILRRTSSDKRLRAHRQHQSSAKNSVEALTAHRSPALPATRYWLRSNTYVDLVVPYEKIGVPFSSAGLTSALTDDEKETIIAELSKCEPDISAGNLEVLELALEICRRCELPTPGWLLPHALEAINKLVKLKARTRQQMVQREVDQLRWATVHHFRVTRRLTCEAAWDAATKELDHTRAHGSEETIRSSYKRMNRHPLIRSMRRDGLPSDIDDFAREQYESRQAISRRIFSLDSQQGTTAKKGRRQHAGGKNKAGVEE